MNASKRTASPAGQGENKSPEEGKEAWDLKELWSDIWRWRGTVGFMLGLVLGIYSTVVWIRTSARSAVLDEKFLTTLAARVRPSCIFNSREAIEADFGAREYIDDIRVIAVPESF